MTEPVDTKALRELLYPAMRTVYATMDIRKKTMARVAILEQLPALLEEVEQLRAANRVQAAATELWMARAQRAEEAIARVIEECAKIAEGWPDHGISKQSLWKLATAIRALEPKP